jgi:hypothetical protein
MTINVTPAAPAGIYTIMADDTLLQAGRDCSGICVRPTYQLIVEPGSDVVELVSLTPSTGSSPAGITAVLPIAVTATILGDAPSYLVYAYAVSPAVEGISLSFVPFVESGSPPSGSYVATMTVSASVPPGVYSIIVGEAFLDNGMSCLPTLYAPCTGVFTLTVYPQGQTVFANLQDSVSAAAAITPPANAPLTDSVHISDTYVAPAIATLTDAVKAIDQYVAPATAALSDAVRVVDSYVQPAVASLSDVLTFTEHLTTSIPPMAAPVGIAGLGLVAAFLVVRRRRGNKQSRDHQGTS